MALLNYHGTDAEMVIKNLLFFSLSLSLFRSVRFPQLLDSIRSQSETLAVLPKGNKFKSRAHFVPFALHLASDVYENQWLLCCLDSKQNEFIDSIWLLSTFFFCFFFLSFFVCLFDSLEIGWRFLGSFFRFLFSALIKTDLFVFLVIVIKTKANANQVVDDLSSSFFKSMELIILHSFTANQTID